MYVYIYICTYCDQTPLCNATVTDINQWREKYQRNYPFNIMFLQVKPITATKETNSPPLKPLIRMSTQDLTIEFLQCSNTLKRELHPYLKSLQSRQSRY